MCSLQFTPFNLRYSLSNAVASEKANPNIEYENNWFFNEGFLATPKIKHPNTTPIPTPAPKTPTVANPAPIIFDDCNIIFYTILKIKIS